MARRLVRTLVAVAVVCGASAPSALAAQALAPQEREALEAWYRRTADADGRRGEWGVAIGTMDGRVLWSMSPELALIPASTAKVFTTGFTRARVGGGVADHHPRRGRRHRSSPRPGRWQGTWALELGGD